MPNSLKHLPSLQLQAHLAPAQGHRFQPTGFPDLGPAEYFNAQGRTQLLVESTQSMANRLEAAIWDPVAQDLIPALKGLPYVRLQHPEHGLVTSLTEAHRLASAYLQPHVGERLERELGNRKRPQDLAPLLLQLDPGCLLHGVFFPSQAWRVTRLLSAFIEASDVSVALSGGVKFDHLDPSGPSSKAKGHVPYSRREYCSAELVAYFHLDLIGLRALGLSSAAEALLQDLALLKIRRFLDQGLRLRTACQLRLLQVEATQPQDFQLPTAAQLEKKLGKAIAKLLQTGELLPVWEL